MVFYLPSIALTIHFKWPAMFFRFLLPVFLCCAFVLPGRKHLKVYLIGDSTMSQKVASAYPETGWGMPFTYFFDSTVTVDNRAVNGRSARTFMEEGRWQPVVDNLEAGDYVFIQFGHNDEVASKQSYTPEEAFKSLLIRYVTETRKRNATPVLLTPVARRQFDSLGHVQETHAVYAGLVRAVAKAYRVALIDLDELSKALLQQLGDGPSKSLFNYLEPGEHPNYPLGKQDNTHFNELGARKMAQLVLAGMRELHLALAERVVVQQLYPSKFVVAQDGSGDFRTIQEAVNAVRDLSQQTVTIFIRKGIYREKLVIPSWKTKVVLEGESRDSTIITNSDFSGKLYPGMDATGKDKFSTYTSYTVLVQGNDCGARNLTIENASGRVGQAVALHVEGDRCSFVHCRFLGNQDTLYVATDNSRQYYRDCFIEGTTDFIFGEATAVFDHCTIRSLQHSYITAASTSPRNAYGFVLMDCHLTADAGVQQVYLGRPWRPYAKTVFIRTEMDGHILPAGWDNWSSGANEETVLYAEYGSKGAGGAKEKRVGWSKQLTAAEVQGYTLVRIFGGDAGWVPVSK